MPKKKKKGGMTKVYEQVHGIKYKPPVYSKEEVEQMSNELKHKHKVNEARQRYAKKQYYQRIDLLESAIETHEAKIERAQAILEKEDIYTLAGKVLLIIVFLAIALALLLLFTMGTTYFLAMLVVALGILVISISVQFLPISAEKTIREGSVKLRKSRQALYQMKNRH